MQKSVKQEVAKYLYPSFGNTAYNNQDYYKKLIKKYGKKEITQVIKELLATGNLQDAFTS